MLPPEKFGGDITLINILLTEVGNHILTHLSTNNKVHEGNSTIKRDSVKHFVRELKSLQYTVGYVVHKLYYFNFSKNKDCIYSKQCVLLLLCC